MADSSLDRLRRTSGRDSRLRARLVEALYADGSTGLLRLVLKCVTDDRLQPSLVFDAELARFLQVALGEVFQQCYGDRNPQELADFNRALRAAALAALRDAAGRLLTEEWEEAALADGPTSFTDEQRTAHARLAVLWTELGRLMEEPSDPCWHPPQACDRPELIDRLARRMLPDGAAPEMIECLREPLTLLGAAQRCLGPSYEVLFPVVWNDHGYLLRARMTVLRDPSVPPGSALLQAPWSVWRLFPGDADELGSRLPEVFKRIPSSENPPSTSFLLELKPPEVAELAPPPVLVRGLSLGLTVVLAAWAAGWHRHLRRMAVTGEIDAFGRVRDVGAVPVKYAAFVKYFRSIQTGRSGVSEGLWTFLIPSGNYVMEKDRTINIVAVGSLADLLQHEADLLTDGFDAYREALLTKAADWKAALTATS